MDKSKLIDKMNECLRHEWTGVAQYAQAGFVVAGLWREVYSEMFFDSAKESFGHAKLVGEKIVALGGLPPFVRVGPPWHRRAQLNHSPDGCCVFLSPEGRCRIHEKFGVGLNTAPTYAGRCDDSIPDAIARTGRRSPYSVTSCNGVW